MDNDSLQLLDGLEHIKDISKVMIFRKPRRPEMYLIVDKMVIYGYDNVSDGAKMTYLLISSFDWPDERGTVKGFSFPSQKRLASIRGVTVKTIQNHLKELTDGGLIAVKKVKTQKGTANIYIINECQHDNDVFARMKNAMGLIAS